MHGLFNDDKTNSANKASGKFSLKTDESSVPLKSSKQCTKDISKEDEQDLTL